MAVSLISLSLSLYLSRTQILYESQYGAGEAAEEARLASHTAVAQG